MKRAAAKKDEELLRKLSQYPWLYDTSHESYKDVIKRLHSWTEIAEHFGIEVEVVRKRWTVLRDRYTKLHRSFRQAALTKSDETPQEPTWTLYPLIDKFMHKYVQHRHGLDGLVTTEFSRPSSRHSTGSASDIIDNQSLSMKEDADNFVAIALSPEPSMTPSPCGSSQSQNPLSMTASSHKRKRLKFNNEDNMCMLHNIVELWKHDKKSKEDDECDLFAKGIAMRLRKLDKRKSSALQIKFLQLLHEAEFENEAEYNVENEVKYDIDKSSFEDP